MAIDVEELIRQDTDTTVIEQLSLNGAERLAIAVLRQAVQDVRQGRLQSDWFATPWAAELVALCGVEHAEMAAYLAKRATAQGSRHGSGRQRGAY